MKRRTIVLGALCLLACALLAVAVRSRTRAVAAPGGDANLVIIVLDAARADHFGCYGYPRPTTPNIDQLAEQSVVFEKHHSQIPFTTPSTASLLTGQFPDTHWVIYPGWKHEEPKETMEALLGAKGFHTALFSSTPCASPVMGVGAHFQQSHYRAKHPDQGPGFSPEAVLVQLESWLDSHSSDRFFAYVHLLPPHSPYRQPKQMTALFEGQDPPGYRSAAYTPWRFEFPVYAKEPRPPLEDPPPLPTWLNLYDANLRYGDWAVGEIVGMLRDRGLLDNTILMVTSDHGEAFGEHGYIWHPHAIHQEASRIPLVVRFPRGRMRGRIHCLTQTIDLLPTICELFGITIPRGVQGRSLLPVLTGRARQAARYTVTESFRPRKYMIRDERFALLLYENPAWRALYDTAADPLERRNIIADRPGEAARLWELFLQHARSQAHPPASFLGLASAPEPKPTLEGIPADAKRQMRALGYLE